MRYMFSYKVTEARIGAEGEQRKEVCSDQERGYRAECNEQGLSHGPSGYFRVLTRGREMHH